MEEALYHRFNPIRVIYSEDKLAERGQKLIHSFKAKGIATEAISSKSLQRISPTVTSQGLMAIFDNPPVRQIEPFLKKYRKIIWCENISDPGNLGTIIRSGLAFGFEAMISSGDTAEFYSPKVVRASAGAVFKIDLLSGSTDEILKVCTKTSSCIIAAVLDGQKLNKTMENKIKNNIILAVGSEADGLSHKIISTADMKVKIEHSQYVESLNAAVASSILMSSLYEL